MPKFTEEQQRAIDLEGENILVSAGAGSGKTAVLSERTLRKVKSGVNIANRVGFSAVLANLFAQYSILCLH